MCVGGGGGSKIECVNARRKMVENVVLRIYSPDVEFNAIANPEKMVADELTTFVVRHRTMLVPSLDSPLKNTYSP